MLYFTILQLKNALVYLIPVQRIGLFILSQSDKNLIINQSERIESTC